tara:strand:- start:292 stop:444 length:153 start_codon:yes stop_codon:yes gene_type:complete
MSVPRPTEAEALLVLAELRRAIAPRTRPCPSNWQRRTASAANPEHKIELN